MPAKSQPIPYSSIPLLSGIGESDLNALLGCLKGHTRSYRRGQFILLDEDRVRYVGVVLSGSVHMLKEDVWGHKTLMTYMGPGELFGETFAFRREQNSYVSFCAAAETTVLFLSMEHLFHPCSNQCTFHCHLEENLLRLIGEKNQQLMEKIEVASKATLREKILAYLSMEAQKQGQKYITVPLNRMEMASYLQANRSAMTRELTQMKNEGIIDFDGNTFVLLESS